MTWKKNVLAALSVLAVGTMALTGCGGNSSSSSGSGDKIVLRYAENQVKDYPTTQAAQKFADLVKEKTNGRITVEVYDSGQLGDEKSVIEQVQFGGIDMSRDLLRRSHVLVVCGHTMTEAMKNDIAVAQRLGITATTLEGILTVKGQGRR